MYVYLTRDLAADGETSQYVDVWDQKPIRIAVQDDGEARAIWVSSDDETGWLAHRLDMLTCVEAMGWYGTVPDDSTMIIRAPFRTVPKLG